MTLRKQVTLGEVCTSINYGVTASADFAISGGPRMLRITDIQEDGVAWDTVPGCLISFKEEQSARLTDGDIVIARTGGTVGKSFLISDPPRAVNASYLLRLRPNKNIVEPEYLSQFLGSRLYWQQLNESARGAAQPNVNSTVLATLKLPLIEINAQRRIAASLKAQLAEVETARAAVTAQLRDVRVLKSKVLETIFSNVTSKAQIGSAAKLQSGYAFKSETFKTSGVRLLRNANIYPGKVVWDDVVFLSEAESSRYRDFTLNDGDVLISLDRPIISSGIKVARVGPTEIPALLVQRVGRFLPNPKKLYADYLFAFLQTDQFISKISGHDQSLGVPHISSAQVEAVEIPLPSVAEQIEISKRLTELSFVCENAESAIRNQLVDLNLLPQKILSAAFEM